MNIVIKYEEYRNDLWRKNHMNWFKDLEQFKDWFFELSDGRNDLIGIPDPEDCTVFGEPSGGMEVSNYRPFCVTYWVHEIDIDEQVVFSDGFYTDRRRCWTDEIKQLCKEMLSRKNNPASDDDC